MTCRWFSLLVHTYGYIARYICL